MRRIVIDSILALEHTGLDQKGNLRAIWPFTDLPRAWCITPSSTTRSNNWFDVIREAPDNSTSAVVSHRCLEFEQSDLGHGSLVGCRINANCDSKPLRTVLSTKILIGRSNKLLASTNITIGGTTLTVRKSLEGDGAVVVATAIKVKFGSRLISTVAGLGCAVIQEHMDPKLTTGSSVSLIVY